jgi:hypothetical protein
MSDNEDEVIVIDGVVIMGVSNTTQITKFDHVELPCTIIINYESVIPAYVNLYPGEDDYPVIAESSVFESRIEYKKYDSATNKYYICSQGYKIDYVEICALCNPLRKNNPVSLST